MRKAISIILILTFITSQGYAGEAISSFSNSDKLAASLVSDPNINPDRSKPLRNDIIGKLEPGAIGNGAPLMELAQGRLPPRLAIPFPEELEEVNQKIREALDIAIRLMATNKNLPSQHHDRAKQTLADLILLQTYLSKGLYLFTADVRGPEDYLLGFNLLSQDKFTVGLSFELIHRLYKISPTRLAQYIFYECVPENGIITERDDHRAVYNEIQSAIFGHDEVLALKKDLREFIAEKLTADNGETVKKAVSFDLFGILKSESGRALVVEWINKYPNNENKVNRAQIQQFIDYINNPTNRSENFIEEIRMRFPMLELMRESYDVVYANRARPPPSVTGREQLFREYISGPIVADVGCGWNNLGGEIINNNPNVKQVIGVDIENQVKGILPNGVTFKQMPSPLSIPLPDKSVDTVILSFVLHHLEVDTIEFMREINRILKPGGKVIVLEDTFTHIIKPRNTSLLTNTFFNLSSDEERLSFLWFVDWFIHNFVNKSRQALVPGNYKTIEVWKDIFNKTGFRADVVTHLGFEQIGSRNPVNRGLLILQKETSIDENELSSQILSAIESPTDYDKLIRATKAATALRNFSVVSEKTIDVLIQAAKCKEFDKTWSVVRWISFIPALKAINVYLQTFLDTSALFRFVL